MRKLSNHPVNVLANIGDQERSVMNWAESFIIYFVNSSISRILKNQIPISNFQSPNSSPAPMTERTAVVTPTDVRYGFNGKEVDSEINGNGNAYDFGARLYDSRLGRWWSVDAKYFRHFELTTYNFSNSSPINLVDVNGDDFIAAKALQPSVECHIKLAFGTTEGIKWQGNKLIVDEVVFRAAAEKANKDGKLSSDQEYLFKSFIQGQVISDEVRITYTENKSKDTATTGEIDSKDFSKAKEDGVANVTINVNHNQKNFEEKVNDTATGKVVKSDGTELTLEEKKATAFWHEVGHIHIWKRFSASKKVHQMQAVGFENFFRRIIGATERKGDNHGKQNQKGEYVQKGSETPYDSETQEETK